MNTRDTRRYEMLVRVREFGAAHADSFPSSTPGGQAFATVAAAVDQLSQHASVQFEGRTSIREATTTKAAARAALQEDLDAIARTARVLAADTRGLDDKFPPPRRKDVDLLTTGRTFLREAAPLAPQFIAHYLPEDFLTDLESDLREFEAAINEGHAGRDMHATAAAEVEAGMESALEAVRHLDVLVPNRLG